MTSVRAVSVLTHNRPQQVRPTLDRLIAAAREHGVRLLFDDVETEKLGLTGDDTIVTGADPRAPVELCVALGGDGTILKGLRRYCSYEVPVLAVNFGEVGFLATFEPEELEEFGFERVFGCDFDVLLLPAIAMQTGSSIATRRSLTMVAVSPVSGETL